MPQRSDAIQPIFFRRRLLQLLQMTVIPMSSLQSGRDSDDQLIHTTKHFAPLTEEFHWLKITTLVCFVLPCISPLLSSSSSSILSHRFRPFLRPHESAFFSSHLISSPSGLFSSLHYTTLLSSHLLISKFLPVSGLCFVPLLFVFSLSSSFVFLVLLCLSRSPSSHLSSFVSLVLLCPSQNSSLRFILFDLTSYLVNNTSKLSLFSIPLFYFLRCSLLVFPALSLLVTPALSLCSLISLSF